MAKGQKRSGREPKKAKASKTTTVPAGSQGFATLKPQKPMPHKEPTK